MSVALEIRPLVDRRYFGNDPVSAHLSLLGYLGAHNHQVVELQVLGVVEHNAKVPRRGVLCAEHPTDAVVDRICGMGVLVVDHAGASATATADRSAR